MNILILSKEGKGLGLATKLVSEGHEVQVYAPSLNLENHVGFFTVARKLNLALKECKIVIADSPDWSHVEEHARIYNRTILGSHSICGTINYSHYHKYDLFTKLDIPTLETEIFYDVGDAFDVAVQNPRRRILIRYDDVEHRCEYRDWVSWALSKIPVGKKVLFQKPNSGHPFVISGWFDGYAWLDAFSVSPSLDERIYQYSIIKSLPVDADIIQKTIYKLLPFLKKIEYHGPVHVDVSLEKSGPLAINMYLGFKYPQTYTLLDFILGEIAPFLHGVTIHCDYKVKKTKGYVAAITSRCMGDKIEGAPIIGINPERLKHVFLHNVTYLDGNYLVAKDQDIVLTACNFGTTIKEASDRVYNVVESLDFPERHYDRSLVNSADYTFQRLEKSGIV